MRCRGTMLNQDAGFAAEACLRLQPMLAEGDYEPPRLKPPVNLLTKLAQQSERCVQGNDDDGRRAGRKRPFEF